MVTEGIYGLANASLDTAWPKVNRIKQTLGTLVAMGDSPEFIAMQGFAALADRAIAPDQLLPRTGISLQRERALSSSFIHIPPSEEAGAYGTRCSTLVVVEDRPAERRVHVYERRFDAAGRCEGESSEHFTLTTAR